VSNIICIILLVLIIAGALEQAVDIMQLLFQSFFNKILSLQYVACFK